VKELPTDQSKVYFGAWVVLLNEKDESVRYRLIGPDEINTACNYISIDSVLGRALLSKPLDAEIKVQTPSGQHRYIIANIEYPAF
jgi:transcription elongation factor GreB